jgi:hypothetical protein
VRVATRTLTVSSSHQPVAAEARDDARIGEGDQGDDLAQARSTRGATLGPRNDQPVLGPERIGGCL